MPSTFREGMRRLGIVAGGLGAEDFREKLGEILEMMERKHTTHKAITSAMASALNKRRKNPSGGRKPSCNCGTCPTCIMRQYQRDRRARRREAVNRGEGGPKGGKKRPSAHN